MGDRKWIEVADLAEVPGRACFFARPLDSSGIRCGQIVVFPESLRDAPDSERVAELKRDLGSAHESLDTALRQRAGWRDRALELKRECAQWREHVERRGDEIDDWMGRANDLGIERDRLVRERDEAKQHAADLECELERVRLERDSHCRAARWAGGELTRMRDIITGRTSRPEQPATQPHFKAGDVVLSSGGAEYQLVQLISVKPGPAEKWQAQGGAVLVHLTPDNNPILERDGTPTDEGLRRLAERAGLQLFVIDEGEMVRGFRVGGSKVVMTDDVTDDDRRALAAALRAMGGA